MENHHSNQQQRPRQGTGNGGGIMHLQTPPSGPNVSCTSVNTDSAGDGSVAPNNSLSAKNRKENCRAYGYEERLHGFGPRPSKTSRDRFCDQTQRVAAPQTRARSRFLPDNNKQRSNNHQVAAAAITLATAAPNVLDSVQVHANANRDNASSKPKPGSQAAPKTPEPTLRHRLQNRPRPFSSPLLSCQRYTTSSQGLFSPETEETRRGKDEGDNINSMPSGSTTTTLQEPTKPFRARNPFAGFRVPKRQDDEEREERRQRSGHLQVSDLWEPFGIDGEEGLDDEVTVAEFEMAMSPCLRRKLRRHAFRAAAMHASKKLQQVACGGGGGGGDVGGGSLATGPRLEIEPLPQDVADEVDAVKKQVLQSRRDERALDEWQDQFWQRKAEQEDMMEDEGYGESEGDEEYDESEEEEDEGYDEEEDDYEDYEEDEEEGEEEGDQLNKRDYDDDVDMVSIS